MINIKLFTALVFVFSSAAVMADTVIEFKYDNKQSQFVTNGNGARINTRNTDEFMLVNFDSNTIYSVDPDKKQVFNFSSSIPSFGGFEPPKIRVDIKPAGNGPNIAGYKTRKYRLSADGEYCGTIYASKDVLKGTAIESMFETLKSLSDSHLKSLGAFAAIIPSCQVARMRLTEKLPYIGAPMRVIDIEGKVESEITRVIKNARVEPHLYALPKNYKSISASEKIEQALSDSAESDNKQKSGTDNPRSNRIPPKAMERIRYYQDMIQRR